MTIARLITLLCLTLTLAIAGCANDRAASEAKDGQKLARRPKLPPTYPVAKAVPRDPALHAQAVAELLAAARSTDVMLRAHAIEGIKDANVTEGYPAILNAMEDRYPMVRFAACLAAGELRLPDARAAALLRLSDSNESVQVGGVFVLHRLGDHRYSHTLEKTAVAPDPRLRANTALVLGLLGEPSAKIVLDVMLRDATPAVRLQAAEALWRLGDRDALEYLITATISRYPDDQMIAASALAAPRNPQISEHLRGMLVSEYFEVSLVAARGMGLIGSDEGYGVAMRGAESSEPRQRQLSALAFGAIGRMDAQNILAKLLKDADADVRVAAAQAILQLRA